MTQAVTTSTHEEKSLRLDLELVLPDVEDPQDACVERLVRLLERRPGVVRAHVVRPGEIPESPDGTPPQRRGDANGAPLSANEAQLCLHYDPSRLTLRRILAFVRAAGAEVTDRYAHAIVEFRLVGTEDDGQRLEDTLTALPGVTVAAINFAGQVARVEYDRRHVGPADIERALRASGATLLAFQAAEHARPALRRSDVIEIPEKAIRANGAGRVSAPVEPQPSGGVRDQGAQPTLPASRSAPSAREGVKDHAEEGTRPEPDANTGWYRRNRELAWSLASGVLLAAGWLLGRFTATPEGVSIALYVGAYIFGARDNVAHFIGDLRRGHFRFNIDLLMVVAAIGAAVLGEWVEGALLLFLFSLGHALEHYALGRARNAIKALAELAPESAIMLRDGREVEVPIGEVKTGDRVVVKPGERVAVDGTVAEGRSGVNQAPITGESVPVDKAAGDQVFAGSVNGEGALVVEVTAAVGDRTLDRVIKLVAEAQTQKAPTQQFTDRFERFFVPMVLVGDVLLIVVPPLLGISTWSESFYRAMAVLVAASPCALALGTPAAVLAGIAQAARQGVLIKGGAYLETLGTIKVLALDKTGTITKGEPAVTDVIPFGGTSEDTLLTISAAVERRSQHPLAKAVLKAAEERSLTIPDAGDLESVTGRGLRSRVDGRMIEIGRLLMFEEAKAAIPAAIRQSVEKLEAGGRTTMTVRRAAEGGAAADDDWLGVLGIADEPRADVRETLNALRAAGIERIVMLTGDNAGVGKAVGDAVGIDEVRASLLPEDKVNALKELAAQGRVAMVGDGVNDAPALAHATVGIAMGGAGTAAALETADVALMGDDLGRLPFAVGLSRRARAVIRQNLYVSLGVIVLLLVATATGSIGIGPAVLAHEGSTLVVIANALRLLAYKGE